MFIIIRVMKLNKYLETLDELVHTLAKNDKVSFKDGLLELFKELQKEGLTHENSQEEHLSKDDFSKTKERTLEEEIQDSSLGLRRLNSKLNSIGKFPFHISYKAFKC